MSIELSQKSVLTGLTRLAAHFEGLRRSLDDDRYAPIVAGSWLDALKLSGFSQADFEDSVACAVLTHQERNITPSHLRQYLRKSKEMPEIARARLDAKEERFMIEHEEAKDGAVPFDQLPDDVKAKLKGMFK